MVQISIGGVEITCNTAEEARSVLAEYVEQDPQILLKKELVKDYNRLIQERCADYSEGDRAFASRLRSAVSLIVKARLYKEGVCDYLKSQISWYVGKDVDKQWERILDEMLPPISDSNWD